MKKYLAELIGTLVLVLVGCGSAVIAGHNIGYLGISCAFGLTLLCLVYAIGPISGCHVNPAVTVAMLVAGKINGKDTVGYIVAQCIGAILAAALLLAIATGNSSYSLVTNGLGQNGFGAHSPGGYSLGAGMLAEILLTFVFILVIFGAIHKNAPQGFAGVAIGLALLIVNLVGIPVTGTSVNPARSIGPAIIAGGDALAQVWLFIVAPILGGILAALIWKSLAEKPA